MGADVILYALGASPPLLQSNMVARPAQLATVQDLSSSDQATRLKALRGVRNAIIGSKAQKLLYISAGAVERVLELVSSCNDAATQVQGATTLGSFASASEGCQSVLANGGLEHLLGLLSSSDASVVIAAARSLKMLLQSSQVPRGPVLQEGVLSSLIQLLSSSNASLAETAAGVMSQCCSTPIEQATLTSAGAVAGLGHLLQSPLKSSQAAAVETLSLLLTNNMAACDQLLASSAELLPALLALLTDKNARMRLLAASCITHLSSSRISSSVNLANAKDGKGTSSRRGSTTVFGVDSGSRLGGRGSSASTGCSSSGSDQTLAPPSEAPLHAAQRAALPVLLRLLLLGEPSVCGQVPAVLAVLIKDNSELQSLAGDPAVVKALAAFVTGPKTEPELRRSSLCCLGSICLNNDEARKQLVEAKALRAVESALLDPATGVRAAAAMCIMALTRSVRPLRSTLMDTGAAQSLCKLLRDDSTEVQLNAAAAVCNLVLEFSSVKDAVLTSGGLSALVALTSSPQPGLRLHSAWALRNLVYKSSAGVRTALLQELPWSCMRSLLCDPEASVQEQAVCILRNLAMDAREHISAALAWGGSDLLACLEEKLDPSRHTSLTVTSHALYTTVNILTGGEAHKDLVMASNLPALLLHHLRLSGTAAAAGGVTSDPVATQSRPSAAAEPRLSSASPPSPPAPISHNLAAFEVALRMQPSSRDLWETLVIRSRGQATTGAVDAGLEPCSSGGPAITGSGHGGTAGVTHGAGMSAASASVGLAGSVEVVLPAVWCIINLTWPDVGVGRAGRVRRLKELGAEEYLRALAGHASSDVRDRVKTALDQLQ